MQWYLQHPHHPVTTVDIASAATRESATIQVGCIKPSTQTKLTDNTGINIFPMLNL
jgi:hypothetical protein